MQSSILVIGLVPAPDFARFLGDLRARYPDATVTALVGNPELRGGSPRADEYLLWGDLPPRALAAELRRRRFSLFVVAFNREYYFTATYWKILLLTIASRARGVLFCEQARLPDRITPIAHVTGMPIKVALMWLGVMLRYVYLFGRLVLTELLFLVLGLLLLLPLVGLVLVDMSLAVVGVFAPRRRRQAAAEGSKE